MKLGDVYKHKENNSIIQIDSFAAPMGKFGEGESIIVFRQIERHNEFEIGSCPSFNGYGTQEEIETEYELLVSQENLSNYSDWDEKLYSENLVENINKILKPKKLKEDLIEYRNLLIAILNSRNAKYTNDCVKSGLKKQIMKNKSLMNFCEGLYEDIEDDN